LIVLFGLFLAPLLHGNAVVGSLGDRQRRRWHVSVERRSDGGGGAELRAPQVDVGQLELAVGEHGPGMAEQLRHLALRRLVRSARGAQPLVERVAPLGAAWPVAPQDHRVAAHVQEAQVLPRVRKQQHSRR
jgi:hypothetical protein